MVWKPCAATKTLVPETGPTPEQTRGWVHDRIVDLDALY